MKLKDKSSVNGRLKIDLIYKDKTINYLEQDNLIVLAARQAILYSMYLPGVMSDPISTLKVGVGGTVDPAGEFPKQVTVDLTSLFSSLTSVPTSYAANLSVPSVTILADIPESVGNGSLINEAGLFTASGTMFNIKTFPGIPKTSDFSIHIEWTIFLS